MAKKLLQFQRFHHLRLVLALSTDVPGCVGFAFPACFCLFGVVVVVANSVNGRFKKQC